MHVSFARHIYIGRCVSRFIRDIGLLIAVSGWVPERFNMCHFRGRYSGHIEKRKVGR